MEIVEDIVIVGGGIAGLATAVALKRIGVKALVLERSEGLRTTGAALTLFPNAWLALDALGVSHKLTCLYPPIKKGYVTDVATGAIQEMSFAVASTDGKGNLLQGPRSVQRKVLLETLAEELPVESIRFSSKITAIESQQQGGASIANVHLADGTTIKAKILIGCDGVHSVVARYLGLSEPVHSGRSAVVGLAAYPEGHGLNIQEPQQFVDGGKRAGFIPLNDTTVYWFLAFKGEKMIKDPELVQKEVIENYAQNFPSLYLDVARHADLSSLSLAPLKFRYPWNIIFGNLRKGNITVVGDAMHPTTPDLGQGGCLALEDAVVLVRHIGNLIIKNGGLIPQDMGQAIDGYIEERRWRTAGLVMGSFLSGWVQQGGSNWWVKFLRDAIFYRFFSKFLKVAVYDSGKLPVVSRDHLDYSNKKE